MQTPNYSTFILQKPSQPKWAIQPAVQTWYTKAVDYDFALVAQK